jgi:hypothetical protein
VATLTFRLAVSWAVGAQVSGEDDPAGDVSAGGLSVGARRYRPVMDAAKERPDAP